MKAITLWQPWASLLACRAKKFDTRGWATSYRGPIAIHAAAKKPSSLRGDITSIIDAMREALGITDLDELPRGVIIATAELVECHRMAIDPKTHRIALYDSNGNQSSIPIHPGEILFDDWAPGRYAWEFLNMRILPEPIPARGGQRIWNWEITHEQ